MPTSVSDESPSLLVSETDVDQANEYYEELDNRKLNFQKRKVLTPKPTKPVVKQVPPVVNPVQKLNKQLNRQFRPDLVSPSPSPPPLSLETISKRVRSPGPVIFDAHAKSVKSSNKKKGPTISNKEKLFNPVHQLTELPGMSNQQATFDGFQVPPGMMLVPAPQQQQQQHQSFSRIIEPSQQPQTHPTVSQYKPPTVTQSNSFKTNRVAPPPPIYHSQPVNHTQPLNSFQTPSSMLSTNHLIQPSYAVKQQHQQHHHQQQQSHLFKNIDQSKSSKKKQKKQYDENPSNINNTNRSFALYNQQNGRIEGVVKNRFNVATDDIEESKIIDDESVSKGKWTSWLSQPLCLGLTRLSGGILFGSMALLGCASIAGLIASIVLYSQDNVTDAQWKILGMVVCAIMLITIIITLLLFVCCYKQGYMFDKDDDDTDPSDPSSAQDAEGNERQNAVLRKIYKFNRPNDPSPIPSSMPHQNTISPSPSPPHFHHQMPTSQAPLDEYVEPAPKAPRTIQIRPSHAPLDEYVEPAPKPPRTIQIHASQAPFDEYAETAPKPPRTTQIHASQAPYDEYAETAPKPPRTIQVPAPQTPIVEYVQATHKQQPRTIQIPAPQTPIIEYVQATHKQQPRTIQVPASQVQAVEYVEPAPKPPRTIQIPAPQTPIIEYVETTQKQPRTSVVRQPQTQQIILQPTHRIEYVDEERGHRIVHQPQYEIVEEIIDRSTTSPTEEIVEIIDEHKHKRRREKKKDKKRGFGGVSVKHLKSSS